MSLSNLRIVSSLALILLLSSCASLFGGSGEEIDSNPDTNAQESITAEVIESNSNQDKSNIKTDSKVNTGASVAIFSGVDPMADIRINSEIRSVYSRVAKLDKEKQFTQAHKLLDTIKSKYPQLSGPDYQKARIYFSQGKLEKALNAVNLSIENNGRNYYSLNLQGIILREQGNFLEAKESYFKAIKAYPPYPNSHLNLGVLADIYLRDLPLALIQYREYMKLKGNKDKAVSNWIIELERRIKSGGQ